jgi:hypothetical protein
VYNWGIGMNNLIVQFGSPWGSALAQEKIKLIMQPSHPSYTDQKLVGWLLE